MSSQNLTVIPPSPPPPTGRFGLGFSIVGLIAVAAFLFQYAWQVSDMKPNIWIALSLWVVIYSCLAWAFCLWATWLSKKWRGWIVAIVAIIIALSVRPLVISKHREQVAAAANPPPTQEAHATLSAQLKAEKQLRERAESKAEEYRKQGLQWLLSATNASSTIPALDQAIAILRQELNAGNTNNEVPIALAIQQRASIKTLEQRRSIEEKLEQYKPYPILVRYAMSSFESRFAPAISSCGGKLSAPPPVPPLEWFIANVRPKANSVVTNCGVIFDYTYQTHPLKYPLTKISINGDKTVPASVEIIALAHSFSATLIAGDYRDEKRCELNDFTNCIKNIDYILNQLFRYKQKEFE
jgi:hypothetical protein